jgi:hypothetical protein
MEANQSHVRTTYLYLLDPFGLERLVGFDNVFNLARNVTLHGVYMMAWDLR